MVITFDMSQQENGNNEERQKEQAGGNKQNGVYVKDFNVFVKHFEVDKLDTSYVLGSV